MSEDKKTWTEEIQVKGAELVEKIKELIKEGNIRKLILLKENGDVLFELPLTAGVAVGGALALMAPVLAAIGAMAALLTKVKVQIIRDADSDGEPDDE